MQKKDGMNLSSLYKLPWTTYNNPNGWIEPTTFCQLKCPHCYRGIDKKGHKPMHKSIESMKKEVDYLIEKRNIQTITIAGGECLLYPKLPELIRYIKQKRINAMLLTNGILLTRKKLDELKEAGATRIVIHLDKYQRKKYPTEKKVNVLREEYCNLFRKTKGISLGFIMPLSKDNAEDLPELISFFKKNADIISLVSFTTLQDNEASKNFEKKRRADTVELAEKISEIYGIRYCAYLKKTMSDQPSWLFAGMVFAGNKIMGSLDPAAAQLIQETHYSREKRYVFVDDDSVLSWKVWKYIFNKSVQKILLRYIQAKISGKISKEKIETKINSQILLVVNSPRKMGNEWDICDACPDAMLHKGKLVPSCLLENIIAGERINLK